MSQHGPPGLSRRALLRLGGAAGAAAALGPLGACAGPTGAQSAGAMTLALNRSLVSLDNKLNQFDAAVTVQRAVRQALTRIGPDLTPEPVLADRFELTAPTEWTVRLRKGVHYSDGSPVLVRDVATALSMYKQVSGSFLASFFPEWPQVEEVDDRVFLLHTERPLPVLDYLMANILITPGDANEAAELPSGIGSGPYVVTAANRGTGTYTLERNDRYWGARRPAVPTVDVRFLPEESSRVVSLRGGEVDVIDTISPDSAEQLTGLPDIAMDSVPGTRINQLFYNFRKPDDHPLSDVRVREALTFAIDGRTLVDDVLVGSVTQADGVVSGALTGAVATGAYVHDPRKARGLLAAAGIGPGDLTLKLIWETGEFAGDTTVMEAVLQMLKDAGVGVTLQQFEPGGDIPQWRQGRGGDWDVIGNGFASPTGLALATVQGMFGGTAEKEKTRDTYQGYVVPEVTDILDRAYDETDPKARQELAAQAQHAVWRTWPCLWAFVPNSVLARRRRVRGLALEASNSYDLAATRLEG
ncbi:peptide/nickel transport system substrate-binding protein [Murinocardiopsis flavida]|uniref:Peptide/nickel transport system substrate-binding protein n=1 Tax=Murinocardiopsis flavida TaxID=645275 RepID=A0A2P8DMF8_9ACTN|nr:ABC transporter substrate-binding protein [Murinocardiopsis flavida]PSK98410.1 peptide/nickel transport system substrate-binding protein [Murinocardiopsis flavida]